MGANTEQSLITRLRELPAKRLRAIMLTMALIVASAQLALVIHHSTELLPEPPGHICVICLMGAGVVGLHSSPPVLKPPQFTAVRSSAPQLARIRAALKYSNHARGPPV